MKLTACGKTAVPEKNGTNRKTTARIFQGAEYIFILPPGPVTHHRPSSPARFLMAVNRKLLRER
jgi:hypothetical protein